MPQRMQATAGLSSGSSALDGARMQLLVLTMGMSVVSMAKPIIGPPMISRVATAVSSWQ